MARVVNTYSLAGEFHPFWCCLNCGSAVLHKRIHDEWHQAVLDAGIAKLQKGQDA